MPAFPRTLMRPRVMPRPIHLTLAASPRISSSSPAAPSTSKKSSTRRRRFPRWTGRARIAPGPRGASTSGDRVSASSGTLGCSLMVRVIMIVPMTPSLADVHLCTGEPLHLHCIVVEGDRIDLLKERSQERFDLLIEAGAHDELPALARGADLSVLDHDLASLDDVARRPEHGAVTRLLIVEHDVRVRAHAQVPLPLQAEGARRARGGDDGDLGQRVLPIQVRQDDSL